MDNIIKSFPEILLLNYLENHNICKDKYIDFLLNSALESLLKLK